MRYKTIILELLQQRPQMHEQLRKERKLLTTIESYAKELKDTHQTWTMILFRNHPEKEAGLVSSEAFEMALKELEDRLPPVSPPADQEELSIDQAMAFIRNPSRSA